MVSLAMDSSTNLFWFFFSLFLNFIGLNYSLRENGCTARLAEGWQFAFGRWETSSCCNASILKPSHYVRRITLQLVNVAVDSVVSPSRAQWFSITVRFLTLWARPNSGEKHRSKSHFQVDQPNIACPNQWCEAGQIDHTCSLYSPISIRARLTTRVHFTVLSVYAPRELNDRLIERNTLARLYVQVWM